MLEKATAHLWPKIARRKVRESTDLTDSADSDGAFGVSACDPLAVKRFGPTGSLGLFPGEKFRRGIFR